MSLRPPFEPIGYAQKLERSGIYCDEAQPQDWCEQTIKTMIATESIPIDRKYLPANTVRLRQMPPALVRGDRGYGNEDIIALPEPLQHQVPHPPRRRRQRKLARPG